jgi:membrane-bound lytic murein transglycosylase D
VPIAATLPPAPATPGPAAGAPGSQFYIVQGGDSVASIAATTGVPAGTLMALNAMRGPDYLYEGQPLRLFGAAPGPDPFGATTLEPRQDGEIPPAARQTVAFAPSSPLPAPTEIAPQPTPTEAPPLASAASPDPADPVDYSVAADGSIRVVAAETLGHYADWLDLPAARLRALNHLQGRTPVVLGRRIRLEFDSVPRSQFEQRRRDYHARLQAAYFAAHRIAGTQVYIVRRGDSLWSITQREETLPVWLLQQYNPDLDFNDLHPGTQLALPQVEENSGP